MFYGAYIFRFVGTIARWTFKGFKGTFREVWNGRGDAGYVIFSNVLGAAIIVTLTMLLVDFRCR